MRNKKNKFSKKYFLFIIIFLSSFISFNIFAASLKEPPPADQVFQLSGKVINNQTIGAEWKIEPGFYLYKDRFEFKLLDPKNAQLGKILYPEGIHKQDSILGKYQVYEKNIIISVPVLLQENNPKIKLAVSYQGCAEDGFCYPPITKNVTIDLNKPINTLAKITSSDITPTPKPILINKNNPSEQSKAESILQNSSFGWVILSFFGFGLLLSLTPCILPMIPILSGIIVGHKKGLTTQKAFLLSLTYVLSMSVTYAIAGILVGLAGQSIQSLLQNIWVLSLFSLLFIILALSMFGLFELKLPDKFEQAVTKASNRQTAGSYIGVAVMGCLASLIVSPCITAPLFGALTYIGQTGNAALGGIALFSLSLGMGVPLLIIGTSGGKYLPKSGPWMSAIQKCFGVLMLGMAIWILERVIPGPVSLFLWAVLLIGSAIFMGIFSRPETNLQKFSKILSIVFLVYGILLLIGASMGNTNPLQPLKNNNTQKNLIQKKQFKIIKNLDNLKTYFNKNNKIIMLDFSADWCVSCHEMERNTFNNPKVKQAMEKFVLLRADITANDSEDKQLMRAYGVIAPPTVLFFKPNGELIKNKTIIGEMGPVDFLRHLTELG